MAVDRYRKIKKRRRGTGGTNQGQNRSWNLDDDVMTLAAGQANEGNDTKESSEDSCNWDELTHDTGLRTIGCYTQDKSITERTNKATVIRARNGPERRSSSSNALLSSFRLI